MRFLAGLLFIIAGGLSVMAVRTISTDDPPPEVVPYIIGGLLAGAGFVLALAD
ncbi:membrane protein [Mycobacterium phage Reindeer]|uniref:Membrane protein n=1 Tax=Mycobacterium phage Reindeer TaxID=2762283 RepID=A0A7G8LHZ5_9CAUD|nr:membrane protein [Mycobacterium phage Reindeer]QNJ56867.1 membrane protein [Mycobacterium phage Reindeer]